LQPTVLEFRRDPEMKRGFSDLYRKKKINADNVDNIHRKAVAITQKKSYVEAA
jgi:hypothetical protein